ncbi:MAG: hypothetical protein U0M42_07865 [Acutalibacteraceae bacterium]|nr:hypothetical protein [Acutalibacteraceae bacterium]
MGLFSKRRKNENDIDMSVVAEQEDLYRLIKQRSAAGHKPNTLTANEIIGKKTNTALISDNNPLEEVRQKMLKKEETLETDTSDENEELSFSPSFKVDTSFLKPKEKVEEIKLEKGEEITLVPETVKQEENTPSILESCLPFIMDGRDSDELPEEKPQYTLESVESILGIEEPDKKEEEPEEEEESEPFEETIIFKAIEKANMPDISDIDTNEKGVASNPTSFTGTMPILINEEILGNTRDVDISEEFYHKTDTQVKEYKDAPVFDDDYEPEDEFTSQDDRKRIRKILLTNRKKAFLSFMGTLISAIILSFFFLPIFSDAKLSFSPIITVFVSICTLLAYISNFDVFASLKSLGTKRTSAQTNIALSMLFSFIGIVLSFFKLLSSEVAFGLSCMTVLSLIFHSYFKLRKTQYMYHNFVQIAGTGNKYAVALIDDIPTTFAMARKAIDGDVLIAAKQRTAHINNFIKNSTVDRDFDGNAKLMFYLSLCFSLLAGVAVGFYRSNFMSGVVSACIFAALFAPFTTIACNVWPISTTSVRLRKHGAMLSGITAARQLEQANAVAIDCCELFPKGSIKLADMKILSENNLEQTIAIACAITSSIKSPLAPIFKTIMETNKEVEVPVADSIKYEERMGITGWVGDNRIFIGNRNLMLAHEISVPDAEVDKKILRDGYFPVYLACDGKALALIVLRYIPVPAIANQLDKITAMGLTLLISNCDQNISEEMLCDYFDLYDDSLKIMSGSGVHMYKTAVNYCENSNTGACVKTGIIGLLSVLFSANRVKRAVSLLQIMHIITAVLGVILFGYIIFGNAALYISGLLVAAFQLICFAITGIAYLFTKP